MVGPHSTPNEKDPSLVLQKYLKEFLDLGLRRKWMILTFILLGAAIGGVLAWFKVDMYRSETVILVEQQKITEKYVPSVVGGSTAERVSTITQQVLSRTNLQKIIDEFNLYPEEIQTEGYESVTEKLREKNIEIKTKGSGGQVEAFTISYAHRDPMMAMKVTAKLASQYIDENLRIREQFIEGASEFLNQELVTAKEALDHKEEELSAYKQKYLGELPSQLNVNLKTLDRLQDERTRIQESLDSIGTRLDLLEKTIRDYDVIQSVGGESQEIVPLRKGDMLGLRLGELKRDLAKMSSEYTDSYPDIIALKSQIKEVEQELEKQDKESGGVPADPYLVELMNNRKELNLQIKNFKLQLANISHKMKDLEGKIERTPSHEQELLSLERDYENLQKNYQRLHENRINAKISENLDKRQKGERFRILDPANLPTIPEGLPRGLLAMGGLGGGIGFGLGLAFLLDMISPTFRRSEEAEISLGLITLATIPSFKMAYGKSMKMIAKEVTPKNENGGKNLIIQKENNGMSIDAEPVGRFSGSKKNAPVVKDAFPPQLNLVTKWRPQSVVAEQYRVAATRLGLVNSNGSHQVVLITSAMKGEGKTSTAANLAYTLAHDLNEPTLVMDCDFKCSNLFGIFGLHQEPGLAEYFSGVEPLEACLQKVPDIPLWAMSVGNFARHPVSLSKLHNISPILDILKSRYRFMILDGPPVLPLADINLLTGLADILLMVVRSGTTPKDVVQKAIEMIHHAGPTRLVMTDAWNQGMPYYVRQSYYLPYSRSSQP